MGTVPPVISFAAAGAGVSLTNPFAGVCYDRKAGVADRQPIPLDDIRKVEQRCPDIDDEARWLIAPVSDTGMRLAASARPDPLLAAAGPG